MAEGYYLGVLGSTQSTTNQQPRPGLFFVNFASNYANMRIYAYILIAQKRTF